MGRANVNCYRFDSWLDFVLIMLIFFYILFEKFKPLFSFIKYKHVCHSFIHFLRNNFTNMNILITLKFPSTHGSLERVVVNMFKNVQCTFGPDRTFYGIQNWTLTHYLRCIFIKTLINNFIFQETTKLTKTVWTV